MTHVCRYAVVNHSISAYMCHIWKKDLEKETVKVKLPYDQVFYGSKFLKKHDFERNFGTEFCAVA